MSQNPTAESASAANLNPLLEEALGCLDVQIEDELARYRKARSQQRHEGGRVNPQITYPQPPPPGTTVLPLPNLEPDTPATTTNKAIDNQIADFTKESTSEGAKSSPNGDSQAAATEAPQEYLASSEQLLRNVAAAAEQEPVEKKKRLSDRLLTPMGISAIFVLGIAMTLLGTTLLYPDLLMQLAGEENNEEVETASQPETPDSSPTATSESTPLNLTGPNLATDEFAPVNPDSLSTVETNPNTSASPTLPTPDIALPSPTATPPSPPTTASDLTTALLPPNLSQPNQTPTPPAVTPSPTPSPAPEASPTPDPVLESAPAAPGRGDRFYYVVVDYAGAVSLQQARAIVPESYVRNFPQGGKIQMGAFSLERDAQTLITRLEQQGIKATIYRRQ